MVETILVSNSAQLIQAMKHATGGEKIVLQAGDYGRVALLQGLNFFANYSSPVTITSADARHPAVINCLNLSGIKNVTLDHIKFDYSAAPGTATGATAFSLNQCSNIKITNSEFNGDKAVGVRAAADGFGTGLGLSVRDSTNITIAKNDVHDFLNGISVSKSTDVVVSGNDIHGMSSDGLNFAQVTNVVIDNNHIHDFARSPLSTVHPDMIQFWTTRTTAPSSDIKIINNFLDMGSGQPTQSIFMRNEMVDTYNAGQDMFYKNVTISNNLIRNGHLYGINVGETNGLVIDKNTMLQNGTRDAGGEVTAPSIYVANLSKTVAITNNVVSGVGSTAEGSHAGWKVHNNLQVTIDDANAANYIGKLYHDALDKTNANLNDFRVIKGSLVDTSHVGSQLTTLLTPQTYTGYIDTHPTSGTNNASFRQTLDASHIFNSLGQVAVSGAKVVWDFGDGTKGAGLVANHVYASHGDYTAVATITLSNGKIVQVDKTLHVQDSAILDVDFNSNALDHSATVNPVMMNTAQLVVTAGGGHAIDLNGGVVKYSTNSDFFNNTEFSLIVDFKKDVGEEIKGGRLLELGGGYSITVGADGLTATFTTPLGVKTLSAQNLGIADTDWHRIGLTFSGTTGVLKLFLDGHEVASANGLVGIEQTADPHANFYLGGLFGGSFGGQIDNLHISDAAISTAFLTSGILATPHLEFGSLAQFEPVSNQLASRSAAPMDMLGISTAIDEASPVARHHFVPHDDFLFG